MLLNGGRFLNYVLLFRCIWIGGRYGSGKTALAVYLGRWLRSEGYRFVSNIPVDGAEREFAADRDLDGSVVLLDEAADFVDAYEGTGGRALLSAFKYVRHFDLVFLFPSIDLVQKRLRKLIVERVVDLSWLTFGLRRVWAYQWWVGPEPERPAGRIGGKANADTGFFIWSPRKRDFTYNGVHRGRGLTTGRILRRLLVEARKSDNADV